MVKGRKIISIVALLYLVALLFFVWGVAAAKYKIFPYKQMGAVYDEIHAFFTFKDGNERSVADEIILDKLESKPRYDFAGFKLRDTNFKDQGYLLISRYSKKHKQTIVELFSIAEQSVLHTWIPALEDLFKQTPKHTNSPNNMREYRIYHPLLLKDGSLIFSSHKGPLAKYNSCGQLVWTIDRTFHHAKELDRNGNIVVPIVYESDALSSMNPFRDDGFAVVSTGGKILEEFSITNILLQNDYRYLLYGVGKFEKDRIHLNDAQPILKNSKDAHAGDIAISMRHLSTVALFRPATKKIIWLKTGPWLNQHDISQIDNSSYSIFGNDIVRSEVKQHQFINGNNSEVYIYDAINGIVTKPFSRMMKKETIASKTEGRLKILQNGDAFIEETNGNRLIRISQHKVRWEYHNMVTENTAGILGWSRYIPADEIDLKWMENTTCN